MFRRMGEDSGQIYRRCPRNEHRNRGEKDVEFGDVPEESDISGGSGFGCVFKMRTSEMHWRV